MDLELKGKSVLIAGSSRGIGRAVACRFLEEGARVLISGRDAKSVQATSGELQERHGAERLRNFIGDLTDPAEIRRCVREVEERWGTPDVVVANVGSGKSTGGSDIGAAEFLRVWELNFLGSVSLVEALLPGLVAKKNGSIVLIGSIAGLEAIGAPLAYASAKSALAAYGKNLAWQLAEHGVRVNTIAPGNILIPGGSWEARQRAEPERIARFLETEVPAKRFGTPEEIADFVVFLSSPRASFATGMCAVVDGGQTRGLL